MAKRLTPNQQEYLKQIKRIRKALSKLRSQGYDVSELAEKYTKDLPNRITKKKLQELQELKPSALKKEANYIGIVPPKRTPLKTSPYQYSEETVTYLPSTTVVTPTQVDQALTPEEATLFTPTTEPTTEEYVPIIEPEPDYDFTEPLTPEERETYEEYIQEEQETEETTDEEPVTEEPEVMVIDNGKEILWVNTITGEVVDRVTRITDEPIDLSEIAIEQLRSLGSHFHPIISDNLNKVIDKMIAEKGAKAVADAFTDTANERPSLLQMLSNPITKYEALQALVSEICERLELDDMSRELMRDYVTRESMSDMDKYL